MRLPSPPPGGWSAPARLIVAAGLVAAFAPIAAGKDAAKPARRKEVPTFARDVAPILQAKCLPCHRKKQVGPFALETYDQARKRAADIAVVAADRVMPPWKPAPGVGPKLKHDQSLTKAEIATLEDWAEAGTPRGDPKDLPAPRSFAEGWKLGPPDLVLEPAEGFPVPADGPDTYRCFVIPTNLAQDAYIAAIDYRPGAPRVVHHMSLFVDTKGAARRRDEAEAGPGYTSFAGPGIEVQGNLGFWAPGTEPHWLPDGIGIPLPRQSDLILQVHYHPTGKAEVDQTRLGLYFARSPVKQALHWNDASNYNFRIPPGNANYEVKGEWFVPVDVQVLAVSPHMHLLGKDMRLTAVFPGPGGKTIDLIHIPDWDPAWQGSYFFQKPIDLPRGARVRVVAHFDNSAHARNPNNPPRFVRTGHGANDEMCVGYIAVVKKGQDLTRPGEKDDLFDIFAQQRVRFFRREMAKQKPRGR